MNSFPHLLHLLEKATSDADRHLVLEKYFRQGKDKDTLWALWLFKGNKPRKNIDKSLLREWTIASTPIPEWLLEASLEATGSLAETCALLYHSKSREEAPALAEWMDFLFTLPTFSEMEKREKVLSFWEKLSPKGRFWFNRLLLGTFRFSLAPQIVIGALADYLACEKYSLWYRMQEDWSPDEIDLKEYFGAARAKDKAVKPLPLPTIAESDFSGFDYKTISEFEFYWFWEGICGQIIRRADSWYFWSEQGEWLTGKFPELAEFVESLPNGTVLSGHILGLKNGRILDSKILEARIKRKRISKKIQEDCPVVFLLGDVLQYADKWKAEQSRKERLISLQKHLSSKPESSFLQEDALPLRSDSRIAKEELKSYLEDARAHQARGILMRPLRGNNNPPTFFSAPPLRVLVVLLYLTRDDRNPGKFSQLSFAVWKGEDLIPIAKCRNNLSEEENQHLKTFAQQHRIEKFGPVTSVQPHLLFSLSYTGIQLSGRRKSGLELQEISIIAWEREGSPEEATSLKELHDLQRKWEEGEKDD